jgi:general secretion pathway protein M
VLQSVLRFWSERAPREQAMLATALILVALTLIYLLLIEPASTGIAQLERGLPGARAQAAELDSLLAEVNALKSRAQVATVSATEARGTIEKSLATAGLKATRIAPLSSTDLQVSLANVPYATSITWLAGIERDLGARAVAVTANRVTAAGSADIEVALRLAR